MTPCRFKGANNGKPRNFRIVPKACRLLGGGRRRRRSCGWRRRGSGWGGGGARRRRGGRVSGPRRAGGSLRGRRRLRLRRRIDPAGMNPSAQTIGNLGIDRIEETYQAAERRLHMAARTAKPVVQ